MHKYRINPRATEMFRKFYSAVILGLLILLFAGCKTGKKEQITNASAVWRKVSRKEILAQKDVPVYTYKIVAKYPHDTTSYTEGLLMNGGYLYEGTGLYNKSRLLKIDLKTGKILKQHKLEPRYFGEGIVIFGNRIFELTYKSNVGFIYDKSTFEKIGTFYYPTQGWGFTTDGSELIMSDGTETLHFFDPKTLKQTRYIVVSDKRGKIGYLNELEYIDGEIFANVWTTDLIARISPKTGKVTGWLDLTGIYPDRIKLARADVLNGIAYNEETKRLLVTGKCWQYIFEIELLPLKNK